MSEALPQLYGFARTGAGLLYAYNDLDDLRSLRWYLATALSPGLAKGANAPGAGEAYLYIEPVKGTFQRPAITVQLITGIPVKHLARDPSAGVSQRLALRVYHETYAGMAVLADELLRALGANGGTDLRVPMWAWFGEDQYAEPTGRLRLGRFMRVVQDSLSMSLEEPDDDRMWSRTLQMTMVAPRNRRVRTEPRAPSITLRQNGLETVRAGL